MKLWCCGCGQYTDAILTTGATVYPRRHDLHGLYFYQCPVCKNFVGTHKKWGYDIINKRQSIAALGCIPTPELKKARQHIHAILDPLWKSGEMRRKQLYKRLAKKLGIKEYHTANIRTIEEARRVYRCVQEITQEYWENKGVYKCKIINQAYRLTHYVISKTGINVVVYSVIL